MFDGAGTLAYLILWGLIATVAMTAVLEGSVVPIKRTSSCFRYNRDCTFLRFCAADPADRADMVELAVATGELRVQEWRPKERDP